MSEIGKTLQEARINKGYTLDDLQQMTKIQKRYLIAIEDEKFSDLPGDFYVRAFVKQYAETVDLDGDELLKEFNETLPDTQETVVAKEQVSRSEKSAKLPKDGNFDKFMSYLPTIIIVVIVLGILGTIYGVTLNSKDTDTQIESSSSKVSVSTDSKAKSSSSESAKASSSSDKKTQKLTYVSDAGTNTVYTMENAPTTSKVKLVASGSAAWSSITADGTQLWQATLVSDATDTVTIPAGTKSFVFSFGNAPAMSITINGKKFDFMKTNATLQVRTVTVNIK
ncbi:helix-turn-helix domain-containing protein [Dellaglioa sp. P0083]|uniref:helix-turn-helix domain-containing protein n=1 Tax=Dellaglioa kimchii TaxID=3344667 RepID=UPI0038D36806